MGRQLSEVSTACSVIGESTTPHSQPELFKRGTGSSPKFNLVDTPPLLSRKFDPFHRTASELRLCGDFDADDSEDLPLQPEAWPPRATAALALEAFGRILNENEHRRQSASDDGEKGLNVLSPTERTDVSTNFDNGDHRDCLYPHGTSAPGHLPCEPLCGVSAVFPDSCATPQKSCRADDHDDKPLPTCHGFLRGLFGGTKPAVKCAEKAAPHEMMFPSRDSTWSVLAGDQRKHIQGAIVIGGSVEERPGAICQALRQALSDVLVQLTPTRITVSCEWAQVESEMTDDGIQIRCHEFCGSMRALVIEPGSYFKFHFTAHLLDPRDSLAALDALHLESSCAGAWRFLPALVESLGHVRRLSVRLAATLSADDERAAIPGSNEI